MLAITGLFAGILALIYVALSINVIRGRYIHKVALGDGGHASMSRFIRAHANFSEYVPIALILLALNEMNGMSRTALLFLGTLIIMGRISHAYSILVAEARASGSHIKFRQAGMAATFTAIIILALAAIFLMYGANPIRKPLSHDGTSLELKSVFATLQGEGPHVGVPSVFVRLGGCNLACRFCDTEFEDFTEMPLHKIMADIRTLAGKNRKLVVITGGEPLRQNIAPLCEALIADGFQVQIETNGTLWRELPVGVEIVCSPKNTGNGYFPVRDDLLPRVNAFKFIVSAHDAHYNHIAEVGQKKFGTPVYVQPMDEHDDARNAGNLALAMQIAVENGYRLSLQTHKILGIP